MRFAMSLLAVAAAFTFGVTACGMGPLSEEDAKKAWKATQQGLGASGSDSLTASQGITFSEEFTEDCADGGTAEFKSNGDVEAGDITAVNFDYEVTLKDCDEDGIIQNGTITYKSNVETSDTGTEVTLNYEGNITYSGEVNGVCDAELDISVVTGTSGVEVTYDGTYCGHDGEVMEDAHIEVETD